MQIIAFFMKKYILIILAVLLSLPAFAQKDVFKTLNGKTHAQIIQMFGQPDDYCNYEDSADDTQIYYYGKTIFSMDRNRILAHFQTDSKDYCILTKFINGGLKVGDPFSKLQSIDFSKTDYGRNKAGNKLTYDCTNKDGSTDYFVFKEEYHYVYFRVKGGVIISWGLLCKSDKPYENYYYDVKIF
jgi:hypothetical protein